MKKALPLLGAIALVSLLAGLNGCVLDVKEITIVVSDYVCTGFDENHTDENYMDETETFDDSYFAELDDILLENDLTKDDVESAEVVGVYYRVTAGPTPPPAPDTEWTVSGRIWVQINDDTPVMIAEYQSVVLTSPMMMTDPVRITTVQAGLDALNAAVETYLSEDNPFLYPDITFIADRTTGDIDPSPTVGDPFVMSWDGCLSMRVAFTEEYEIYDLFPAE